MRVEGGLHATVDATRVTPTVGATGVGTSDETLLRAQVGSNRRVWHVYLSGVGLGASSGDIEGSIDGSNWFVLASNWTANAAGSAGDGTIAITPWVRLSITAEDAQPWTVHLLVTE